MIRAFGVLDAPALPTIQLRSIERLGPLAYSPEQVSAWAARVWPADRFLAAAACDTDFFIACEDDNRPVGYASMEPDGHLDQLYVHPDHTERGHARALLQRCAASGCERALNKLYTEASEIARPVFEKSGWQVEHRRDFDIDGVAIHNYAMTLKLA